MVVNLPLTYHLNNRTKCTLSRASQLARFATPDGTSPESRCMCEDKKGNCEACSWRCDVAVTDKDGIPLANQPQMLSASTLPMVLLGGRLPYHFAPTTRKNLRQAHVTEAGVYTRPLLRST